MSATQASVAHHAMNNMYPHKISIADIDAQNAINWCKNNTNNWDLQFANDNVTLIWLFKDPCIATQFKLTFG